MGLLLRDLGSCHWLWATFREQDNDFRCSHFWLQELTTYIRRRGVPSEELLFIMNLVPCIRLYLQPGIFFKFLSRCLLLALVPPICAKLGGGRLESQCVTHHSGPYSQVSQVGHWVITSLHHLSSQSNFLGGKGHGSSLQRMCPLVGSQFIERMKFLARHIKASAIGCQLAFPASSSLLGPHTWRHSPLGPQALVDPDPSIWNAFLHCLKGMSTRLTFFKATSPVKPPQGPQATSAPPKCF